ncbi:flagellar protein FlgN [Halanaerobacter jeridensis]|uniref:Flagellar biosynthesis/type III secretory pathway chaperone n=1 Tax=Halanaerobacter jeridensis TaxID=706427 RepID=A0A938XY81_9FIRM|nr:flagellar protein FlgN [Halanaerobacter jeridensis]MBM7557475.1 flagellar biosynthesis/type III secretory pathway chaperone [Halanaerobacter jeridensis]
MQQLVDILKGEYTLYQDLYNLADRKTDLIVDAEIEKLENVIAKEEKLVKQVKQLEAKRQHLTGERSLTEFIHDTNPQSKERLEDLRNKLLNLTTKLRETNQLNNKLLKNALQLTNLNINLLTNNSKQGTYGKKGSMAEEQGSESMLNHKA